MNTKLRIALHHQMHVVRHDFQREHFCLMLLTDFCNDLLEALCYTFYEDLPSIFRTKYDVILTRVVDISVRFVRDLAHADSIQDQTIYCQDSGLPLFPSPKQRTRLISLHIECE